MKSESELLELAAKASGTKISHWATTGYAGEVFPILEDGQPWMPHLDDGDAFRLAAKLELIVDFAVDHDGSVGRMPGVWAVGECSMADPAHSARVAILRAAATVGETL
jgi:hypothetical protein